MIKQTIQQYEHPNQYVAKVHQDITFNIIYVGGTVQYLLPFVHSLVAYEPDCNFRLIANGCSDKEEKKMKAVCQQYSTLSFMSLNSPQVQAHGNALTYLQQVEQSPYFAIMDSDIFAVGPFLKSMFSALEQLDGFFSCTPIQSLPQNTVMPAGFRLMYGPYLKSQHGWFLGGTYFAVYRNHALTTFINGSGIAFDQYRWDDLPPIYRKALEKMELTAFYYDTGKALNILMQNHGCKLGYEPLPNLVHLGNYTGSKFQNPSLTRRMKELIRPLIPPSVLNGFRMTTKELYRNATEQERVAYDIKVARTLAVRQFLHELFTQNTVPASDASCWQDIPPEKHDYLKSCGEQMLAIYARYGYP